MVVGRTIFDMFRLRTSRPRESGRKEPGRRQGPPAADRRERDRPRVLSPPSWRHLPADDERGQEVDEFVG